jgi:hypothetical protein
MEGKKTIEKGMVARLTVRKDIPDRTDESDFGWRLGIGDACWYLGTCCGVWETVSGLDDSDCPRL